MLQRGLVDGLDAPAVCQLHPAVWVGALLAGAARLLRRRLPNQAPPTAPASAGTRGLLR